MKNKRCSFKEKGQILLEVVVTLLVAMVIIGSIVSLVNKSNQRATLSRQSEQATRLAQEGMEIVRNIKGDTSNGLVRVGDNAVAGVPCGLIGPPTYCSFNDLYSTTQGTINAFLTNHGYSAGSSCPASPSAWCLVNTQPDGEKALSNIFNRSIEIWDDPPIGSPICGDIPSDPTLNSGPQAIKRVTVTVSWDSPIGHQERKVVSCLGL
ncbi:MAG: hypothetical protein A2172_04280 [Candidatus Woykebacteria bacterium RBG_13_40_15]|uniref:Uncharacterized protein n=1 Tax=Candidatus Woykebacteria bacterium RBG_13_40_15 TaxID=1802593 RepID=A0A1G1W6W9_9BACT|nr:MAG: hypothetical protein A2172_04280 [Candidatus Woykebacteria bacterium RBG_13_40_15]